MERWNWSLILRWITAVSYTHLDVYKRQDFERISDHSINVVESVQQMRKENLTFSRKGEEEMNLYGAAIRDILTRTTDAFVNNDQALAHTVEPLEEVIDELNKDVKKHHMKRLRKGKCSMELGLLLSDLAMNYERVADHCSNIAVYMMQQMCIRDRCRSGRHRCARDLFQTRQSLCGDPG